MMEMKIGRYYLSMEEQSNWSFNTKWSACKYTINIIQTEQAIFISLEKIQINKHKYISKNNSRKKKPINLEGRTECIWDSLDGIK